MRTLQSRVRIIGLVTLSLLAVATAHGDDALLVPGIGAPNEVSNADRIVAVGDRFRYEDGLVVNFPPEWCRLNSVSDDGAVMVGAFCIDGHEVRSVGTGIPTTWSI